LADTKEEIGLNINFDTTPVYFTDNVFITSSEDGIVMDFTQKLMNTNTVRIVSRVGMSREHARRFVDQLEAMLKIAEGQAQSTDQKKKIH